MILCSGRVEESPTISRTETSSRLENEVISSGKVKVTKEKPTKTTHTLVFTSCQC